VQAIALSEKKAALAAQKKEYLSKCAPLTPAQPGSPMMAPCVTPCLILLFMRL
jgi:hypothetical protein